MTMFEKLADVIITINKAFHAVVERAARIDWTPLLDGRVHRAFVTRAAEVAIARDDLSDAERGKISRSLNGFTPISTKSFKAAKNATNKLSSASLKTFCL